jgi:hypothetical protein
LRFSFRITMHFVFLSSHGPEATDFAEHRFEVPFGMAYRISAINHIPETANLTFFSSPSFDPLEDGDIISFFLYDATFDYAKVKEYVLPQLLFLLRVLCRTGLIVDSSPVVAALVDKHGFNIETVYYQSEQAMTMKVL